MTSNKILPYATMISRGLLHIAFAVMISKAFGTILVSFGLFESLEILDLAMWKMKKSTSQLPAMNSQ
jgi:hypothetical protein